MNTLYQIKDELQELMLMMDEDPDNEVIADTLEALRGELEIKAEGYCKAIAEYEHRAAAIKKEIDRLDERKTVAENNAKKLKDALFDAMKVTGNEKIRGDLFYLYIKNNAESLDQVPEKLPDKYLIPQPSKVDRKQLLKDIKAGVQVDGVTTKRTQSLIIK